MLLRLIDRSADMVAAWERCFRGAANVEIQHGDILAQEATAIVSPANSFGFMDGGIDLAYSQYFGWELQARLQKRLRDEFGGEIPVGVATIVPTGNARIPLLISAPTMRIPEDIRGTVNAYLAFRAAVLAARAWAGEHAPVVSVLCPGLGTGAGVMEPLVCARQMHFAYSLVAGGNPWLPARLGDAIEVHHNLSTAQRGT